MEEENCHFVYKHLWSPMKAPCSLGWVSPRRGEGPGTQSIPQRRDFQAEAWSNGGCYSLWKVSLAYQDSDPVCLPEKIISYPPDKCPPLCGCVWKHLLDTPEVLSQYHFTSESGQIRELLCEYGSFCFPHCSLPLLERCFFIWASVERTCQKQ